LIKCSVIDETPAGHGFGEAELKLASSFHMTAENPPRCPTAGGVIIIPMTWSVD
jgi:hypothetical protein